jgi:hypothetical protein
MTPGFDQLRAMPDILASVAAGLTHAEAAWKPSPARWSVLDVLGHLAHVELYGFRARAERILSENNPILDNYDPDAFCAEGAYAVSSVAAGIEAFRRERDRSLAVLAGIPPEAFSRSAVHAALGPITLLDLLNEWPFHDLGHLRQIAELVRAVKFYPHLGAWQHAYSVNP